MAISQFSHNAIVEGTFILGRYAWKKLGQRCSIWNFRSKDGHAHWNVYHNSGYIRIGSNVWAKALNGDYYRGQVTALSDKVYLKFENGDTIAHDREDPDALVYDMDPNPNELKIGTKVIAHWSGLSAYLPGTITKIEGNKYHVLYDDGDRGTNRPEQMRILKPPLFFGPGSGRTRIQKSLSMKATSLIGSTSSDGNRDGRVSVSADVNRSRPPMRSPSGDMPRSASGDDNVFREDKRVPSGGRASKAAALVRPPQNASPPVVDKAVAGQSRYNADIKSETARSSSLDSKHRQGGSSSTNQTGRSKSAGSTSKGAMRGQPSPENEALNPGTAKNSKTGVGYQITDL